MTYTIFCMFENHMPLYCIGRGTKHNMAYWQMTANEWFEADAWHCWYVDLDNLLKEFFESYKEPIGPNWEYRVIH